ncbi:hypothetical protein F5Y01DRAFT_303331 [Xylaria sp. FL0043]|nr:hypothetical protein F5Y01DRAFT_303331 [Xylaria sp. FL0043]
MLAATNLGSCIRPVVGGGAILANGNPRWRFVTLVIFCASALLLIEWTMPETGRSAVGNGAVEARGIWATRWQLIRPTLTHKGQEAQEVSPGDLEKASRSSRETDKINCPLSLETNNDNMGAIPAIQDPNFGKAGRGKLSILNPFPSVRLIFRRDTALILWLCQHRMPHDDEFNDLEVGLSFLAGGGVIAGGVIACRLMDRNFKKAAIKAGFSPDKRKGVDIDCFLIEEARTTASTPTMLVSIPGRARASNNVCHYTLSAVLVAILQPTVKAIGYSWLFAILAPIEGLGGMTAVWTLRR